MDQNTIDAAIEDGNAKLQAHFSDIIPRPQPSPVVYLSDAPGKGESVQAHAFTVWANGEIKAEGAQALRVDDEVEAIRRTVQAVIDHYPNGGALYVRSPLSFHRCEPPPEGWPEPAPETKFFARIRCVAV